MGTDDYLDELRREKREYKAMIDRECEERDRDDLDEDDDNYPYDEWNEHGSRDEADYIGWKYGL